MFIPKVQFDIIQAQITVNGFFFWFTVPFTAIVGQKTQQDKDKPSYEDDLPSSQFSSSTSTVSIPMSIASSSVNICN